MSFFGAAHGWGDQKEPLPKICQIYPAMMKLGTVKRSNKYINHVTHSMSPADISTFSPKISKFCYIKIYLYRLHFETKYLIILAFLESLRIVLIKKSYKFDDAVKIAFQGFLKIAVFWNKDYDVIIYVHDVTNKILSHDSNYIVDMVIWSYDHKFGNSSISIREVIITSIL